MRKINKLLIALLLTSSTTTFAQVTNVADSLSLSGILSQVMTNYPLLKKAEKELLSADAKMDLTKTAYLPDINFSGSYTRIGPVVSIPFGGKNLELYPPDVYNATVSINENIYDFGRTNKNLALDKKNKEMVQLSVGQTKQRLSMAIVGNFFSINFLQEAIKIKEDQLKNLNEHLQFVQKKAATGSAIQYDVISTKVRISVIENQKIDLQTALQVQTSTLNSYLGKNTDNQLTVKNTILDKQLVPSVDSLCNTAFTNRSEMKMALKKEEIAKSRLDVINVQNNPSLNAFGSGGFKNGYFNSSFQDTGLFNFAVGVGLKVPIFPSTTFLREA